MLKIKKDFKDLIPPLTAEEFNQLEQNCIDHGIQDAIKVWNDYVIDGHNRYEIAQKHKLEFTIESIEFENEYEVIDWMLCNQLGRRNLTEPQKDYLIGKRYENDKKREGRPSNKLGQNVPVSTAQKLAEEYGISDRQVKRNEEFAKGVDIVAKINPTLSEDILSKNTELTKGDVQELGKIEKELRKQLIEATEDQIEQRAKEIAKNKLQELEEQRKNHYLQVANRIKKSALQPQSFLNEQTQKEYQVTMYDVYLVNDRHKLIIADTFADIDFIKENAGTIDCVLTDPPYGISYKSPSGNGLTQRGDYQVIQGDNIEFDPAILFSYSNNIITWGANYYANKLDNSAGWLVWDKRDGVGINLNSDCELAWSNMINSARLFHHTWNGMIKASEHGEKRIHPTQKPINLFKWCLDITKAGLNVLDVFAGSGIIIPACELTNRNAIAVEKDVVYGAAILSRMNTLGYKIEKI